jgi:C1A family cysteine protease
MSSIFIETTNEKQLTVEEYVRYIKIKDHIQQVLDNTDIKEALREAEESINGLTVDLIIKYSVNKKRH